MTFGKGREARECAWLAASEEVGPLEPLRYIELERLNIPSVSVSCTQHQVEVRMSLLYGRRRTGRLETEEGKLCLS